MTSSPDPSRTLTPEMISEAAWRLGWLGMIYSGAITFGLLVRHVFWVATATGNTGPDAVDVFRLSGIGIGLAIFGLSRSRLVSPQRLLDFGLWFEVAGAFAIAAAEFRHGVPASAYECPPSSRQNACGSSRFRSLFRALRARCSSPLSQPRRWVRWRSYSRSTSTMSLSMVRFRWRRSS
jgi:hypothetical protein